MINAAEITFIEWPAAFERVSGVAFGAAADCFVVLDVADGAHSAHSRARIGALEIETGLVFGALLVLRALWIAALERIAQEIGRARTHGAVILVLEHQRMVEFNTGGGLSSGVTS